MTNKKEVRSLGEVRAEEGRKIVGYAAKFNSETNLGGFREVIAAGAFTESLNNNDDVRALVNHDSNIVLGRNTAGTLRLVEDDVGLRIEIDAPDTQQARDLIVSMERGDITQMSFGFYVQKQEWDEGGDVPLRTIRQASLFDVSVVTYPAYNDTEASVRSIERAYEEFQKVHQNSNRARKVRMRINMDLKVRGAV